MSWLTSRNKISHLIRKLKSLKFTDLPESSWQAQGPPHRSFCGKTHIRSSHGQQALKLFSVWSGSRSELSADPPPLPLMSTVKHESYILPEGYLKHVSN